MRVRWTLSREVYIRQSIFSLYKGSFPIIPPKYAPHVEQALRPAALPRQLHSSEPLAPQAAWRTSLLWKLLCQNERTIPTATRMRARPACGGPPGERMEWSWSTFGSALEPWDASRSGPARLGVLNGEGLRIHRVGQKGQDFPSPGRNSTGI